MTERAPKPKKDASLTMRLTRQTKDTLEKAAAEAGRSVSETAERWLDLAATGHADLEGRLGGGDTARALLAMGDFAQRVREEIGDPAKSLPARDAVIEGWISLVARSFIFTPDTPDGAAARAATSKARQLAEEMVNAILALELEDDDQAVRVWYLSMRGERSKGLLSAGRPTRPLMLMLSDYIAGRMTTDGEPDLIEALRAAPPETDRLAVSPSVVADAIESAREAMAVYMAPRKAATLKAREMIETVAAPPYPSHG